LEGRNCGPWNLLLTQRRSGFSVILMIERVKPLHSTLKSAPGVLYQHVSALIRKRLLGGELLPGDRLASIEALAQSYGVAVVTVRQALALLEEEGLIERRHGRGTFVTEGIKSKRWLKLESNWDSLIDMWGRSRPRPVKVLDKVGTPLLEEDDGTPAPAYRFMRRVHTADNTPYAVIDIYVDRRIYTRCPDRFNNEMVIVVLDSLEVVNTMRQRLTIGTADLEVAYLLRVPVNSAVGIMRRVITDHNDVAIYVGEAIYRGDLVRLEREIKRG
jgi:GntR family transcriptional regulator